ncbi:MAG: M56 family metallopeptidase [Clostridiales bacterium]|nr:M56 family metallopeptidase [Clostridiales bacterium]
MRSAIVYNFLLEANIIAGIAILLMLLLRKLLRKQLGSRAIAFAWLLVAIRLLCPLTLPNPAINEIRSPFANDQAIRPIAGQVKVRLTDMVDDLDRYAYRQHWSDDSIAVNVINSVEDGLYDGTLPEMLLWIYLGGAACVAAWFVFSNIRFRHMMKAGRVEPISGKVEMQYHELCLQRKVRPLKVYYTDPLPSACLVGVIQPYIALPLTSKPNETIHVLTHEVCHYKGWDHIWGIVRLVCCILHWFNPLVWLAAYLSKTDCELACDERVTQEMAEDQRKEYASVLVLAAARKTAPGVAVLATGMTMTGKKLQERVRNVIRKPMVIKWLTITFVLVACILLIAAFCTSEYFPRASYDLKPLSSSTVLHASPISNESEAISAAKQIWESPYLKQNLDGLEWYAERHPSGYRVVGRNSEFSIQTLLMPTGEIIQLNHYQESPRAGMYEELSPERIGMPWADMSRFLLTFMDTFAPEHAQLIEAMDEGIVWRRGDTTYAKMHGLVSTELGIENGFSFSVMLEPEVRILSYNVMQPVQSLLWREEIKDFSPENAHRVNGILARAYTQSEMARSAEPPAEAMKVEDALALALDVIYRGYGETAESMQRFEVRYMYVNDSESYFETPYWQFDFNTLNPTDMYEIILHDPDGTILYQCGREEGNG